MLYKIACICFFFKKWPAQFCHGFWWLMGRAWRHPVFVSQGHVQQKQSLRVIKKNAGGCCLHVTGYTVIPLMSSMTQFPISWGLCPVLSSSDRKKEVFVSGEQYFISTTCDIHVDPRCCQMSPVAVKIHLLQMYPSHSFFFVRLTGFNFSGIVSGFFMLLVLPLFERERCKGGCSKYE